MRFNTQWLIKTIAAVLFYLTSFASLLASEVTHVWTFGDVTNRVGLLGIKDGVGQYRTQILYGPRWNEYWELPVHIYTFVLLVFFAGLLIGFGFVGLRRLKKKSL